MKRVFQFFSAGCKYSPHPLAMLSAILLGGLALPASAQTHLLSRLPFEAQNEPVQPAPVFLGGLQVQPAPVWDCWVIETGDPQSGDGSGYVTLMFARDSLEFYKNRYPTPAHGMDGVKALCRSEIARLQGTEAKAVVKGKVDLSVPVVEPPPPTPPTEEEMKRNTFIGLVGDANTLAAKRANLVKVKADTAKVDGDLDAKLVEIKTALDADPNLYDDLLESLFRAAQPRQ